MATTKFDLRNPIFHDDDAAREHLESILWPQGPLCPRCGVSGDRITKLQGKSTRPGVYKCKDCRKPFSVTVGTVMERSHIPLSKWLLAAQLMASSKKSMSAHQLHRMLGTSYEAAWFLFHRLREAANDIAISLDEREDGHLLRRRSECLVARLAANIALVSLNNFSGTAERAGAVDGSEASHRNRAARGRWNGAVAQLAEQGTANP